MMSTEFTLCLEKAVLNEALVLKGIHDLGFAFTTETPNQNPRFECESCYDALGFAVTLVKSMEPPNNVMDIRLLGGEFEYAQLLAFWFNDEVDLGAAYKYAMRMILGLLDVAHTRAFLETKYAELCFFNEDKCVYIEKSSAVWNYIGVREELNSWKVIEVTL